MRSSIVVRIGDAVLPVLLATLTVCTFRELTAYGYSPSLDGVLYAYWVAVPACVVCLYFVKRWRAIADRMDAVVALVILALYGGLHLIGATWPMDPNTGANTTSSVAVSPITLGVLVSPGILALISRGILTRPGKREAGKAPETSAERGGERGDGVA